MTRWISETLYPDWGQRFRVLREVARVRSAYQDILIFDSASHGRVMLLDGAVQITEADEFVYQEMIAHVPLLAHGDARRVLIIGDGVAYVAAAPDASVDVIIVDSTDPAGVGEVLFSEAFYAQCARVLSAAGVIVTQSGVPFMQRDELARSSARRRLSFAHVSAYVCAVPTYVGGLMTLGIAAKRPGIAEVDAGELARRAERAGVLGTTRYWSPGVQVAGFSLPPYVAEALSGDGSSA